jgi:hypothetical protein
VWCGATGENGFALTFYSHDGLIEALQYATELCAIPCDLAFDKAHIRFSVSGFAFSGLELRLMTLSTKYQEFARQQVKQPSSLDFDPDVILWHCTNGAGRLGRLETGTIFPLKSPA